MSHSIETLPPNLEGKSGQALIDAQWKYHEEVIAELAVLPWQQAKAEVHLLNRATEDTSQSLPMTQETRDSLCCEFASPEDAQKAKDTLTSIAVDRNSLYENHADKVIVAGNKVTLTGRYIDFMQDEIQMGPDKREECLERFSPQEKGHHFGELVRKTLHGIQGAISNAVHPQR